MDKIKRIILFNIPMSICNFRCDYCYLTHRPVAYQGRQVQLRYTPQEVAYALRPERLGGLAYINFCAEGETLLTKNIDEYIYELVKAGHYAEIVTNLTVTPVLDKILSWDKSLLKRITFKCSFHYLELKKKNWLDTFAENVKKIWNSGASASVEITPSDSLIPYIDEVKQFSMDHFGALPHLSIARNDNTEEIDYLTDLTQEEYQTTWEQFGSSFWEFKRTIFKKPVKKFCYAGDWMMLLDFETGNMKQCYCTREKENSIFRNPDKPIPFKAIGKCPIAHCYNGHALLTLGCVPDFTDVRYGDIRNRTKADGSQWLQPELLQFFNTTLCENNKEYSYMRKSYVKAINHFNRCLRKIYGRLRRMIKKQKRDKGVYIP